MTSLWKEKWDWIYLTLKNDHCSSFSTILYSSHIKNSYKDLPVWIHGYDVTTWTHSYMWICTNQLQNYRKKREKISETWWCSWLLEVNLSLQSHTKIILSHTAEEFSPNLWVSSGNGITQCRFHQKFFAEKFNSELYLCCC